MTLELSRREFLIATGAASLLFYLDGCTFGQASRVAGSIPLPPGSSPEEQALKLLHQAVLMSSDHLAQRAAVVAETCDATKIVEFVPDRIAFAPPMEGSGAATQGPGSTAGPAHPPVREVCRDPRGGSPPSPSGVHGRDTHSPNQADKRGHRRTRRRSSSSTGGTARTPQDTRPVRDRASKGCGGPDSHSVGRWQPLANVRGSGIASFHLARTLVDIRGR